MSLWSELKRRNVIRVGVAYLVGAWLLLQITDVLMSVLGLPQFTGKLVFVLLLIGFVPTLVFAWVYQVTPEGLRRDTGGEGASLQTARNLDRVTIAMLVVVTGLVLFDRYQPRHQPVPETVAEERSTLDPTAPARTVVDEQATPSLAVLPFANMSPDADNEYFADGISEELLNLLVKVEGMRVPSRTSSFAYKGQNKDIREIARELQVNHILEGSVRKAGNQVRITAQLIDTDTDTHLWSQSWDRELADIFAIQEEIANHIVEALKGVLSGGPIEHRPTDNLDAYTLFLQGRHLFQQRGQGIADAVRLLERAVALDPGFVEAWATLAVAWTVMPNYVGTPRGEALAAAQRAADRALRLQPGNVEAMLTLGQVEKHHNRFGRSLELHQQAVDTDPDNALAQLWLAIALLECGYLSQALPHAEAAVQLEPASGVALDWLARNLVLLGRFDEAFPSIEAAHRLGRGQAVSPLTQIMLATGDFSPVERELAAFDSVYPGVMAHLQRLLNDPAHLPEALAFADQVHREAPDWPYDYYLLNFLLAAGDASGYFAQLQQVLDYDDSANTFVWMPAAIGLRSSPGMQDWITEQGMDALWAERGAPDLCTLGEGQWRCQ